MPTLPYPELPYSTASLRSTMFGTTSRVSMAPHWRSIKALSAPYRKATARRLLHASALRVDRPKAVPRLDDIPPPNPPKRMVEEVAQPKGLRKFIRALFQKEQATPAPFVAANTPPMPSASEPNAKFLHTDKITNLLYWYCIDLSFSQSDFERISPPGITFNVTRARNPANLTRWMGYFLEFKSKEDAATFYKETIGSELCGFPLKLRFTQPSIQGFQSEHLQKVAGSVPRKCHVVALGFPYGFSEHAILRVLWDYDLVDDDKLAVERMPMENVRYGGNPVLLRFKSEKEAERFVRDYNLEIFPYTNSKILCEVVD